MSKLPFILSIPHGGTAIPRELKKHLQIGPRGIFEDSDAYAREIFNIEDHVLSVAKANIARVFVDVDQADSNLDSNNDSVFKSQSSYDKTVYQGGYFPEDDLKNALLDLYYYPYHQKIERNLNHRDVIFGFDCHTMAETGPPFSNDPGDVRPMVCISNNNGKTCDNRLTRLLAQCFQQFFGVDADQVRVNKPFAGGYIIREYGYNPVPWLQIAINRSLYLHPNWYNSASMQMDEKRLQTLNYLFLRTLTEFSKLV